VTLPDRCFSVAVNGRSDSLYTDWLHAVQGIPFCTLPGCLVGGIVAYPALSTGEMNGPPTGEACAERDVIVIGTEWCVHH
jgi:hypothetical protein